MAHLVAKTNINTYDKDRKELVIKRNEPVPANIHPRALKRC